MIDDVDPVAGWASVCQVIPLSSYCFSPSSYPCMFWKELTMFTHSKGIRSYTPPPWEHNYLSQLSEILLHGKLAYSLTCIQSFIYVSMDPCFCCCYITSVMSDSVWPHRQQPTRLLCPWDSPGKNTGVGFHFLLPVWTHRYSFYTLEYNTKRLT